MDDIVNSARSKVLSSVRGSRKRKSTGSNETRKRRRMNLQESNDLARQRHLERELKRQEIMNRNRHRAVSPDKREIVQYLSGDEDDFKIVIYEEP
jgi:hypothetical protein